MQVQQTNNQSNTEKEMKEDKEVHNFSANHYISFMQGILWYGFMSEKFREASNNFLENDSGCLHKETKIWKETREE